MTRRRERESFIVDTVGCGLVIDNLTRERQPVSDWRSQFPKHPPITKHHVPERSALRDAIPVPASRGRDRDGNFRLGGK